MMTSAGGATHVVPRRQSNCVAPPGLDTVFAFTQGSRPARGPQRARFSRVGVDSATFSTRLPALSHSGKGDINRPEPNLGLTKSFWRGHDFSLAANVSGNGASAPAI